MRRHRRKHRDRAEAERAEAGHAQAAPGLAQGGPGVAKGRLALRGDRQTLAPTRAHRCRVKLHEHLGGLVGPGRDIACARWVGDAEQQAHHPITQQKSAEEFGKVGRAATQKASGLGPAMI